MQNKSKSNNSGDPIDVQYSKALAYILRHAAQKQGFTIDAEGFVPISEILAFGVFGKTNCTTQDLYNLAAVCPKKRWILSTDKTKIKARPPLTAPTEPTQPAPSPNPNVNPNPNFNPQPT